jgi:predicted MFS family arabinose efflux permease
MNLAYVSRNKWYHKAMVNDNPQAKVGVLKERNMRWYLGGQLLSLTGTMLQTAVLSLLILSIVGKTDAPYWVGIVWALDLAPGFLLAPFAGILLDRLNKRKVLMVTSLFGVLQSSVLVFLTYTHQTTIFEINILALLMGIVNAVDGPGRNVIIKDAVEHEYNVRQASKMFSSLYNLAQVVGPGLAGFLILSVGYPLTFVLNAVSFAALIVALANMRLAPRAISSSDENRPSIWRQVGQGAKYVFSQSAIRLSVLLTGAICTFGFFYYAILSVIARDMFNGNQITYSYFAIASGVGSFLGALILIKFNEKISHKLFVILGILLLGTALALLSQTTNVLSGVTLLFCAGFGFMVSFSSLRSSIIHLAKHELTGIVMGFTFTFFYGGMMLGSLGAGYFANLYGCPAVLLFGGMALVLIGLSASFLSGINEIG